MKIKLNDHQSGPHWLAEAAEKKRREKIKQQAAAVLKRLKAKKGGA